MIRAARALLALALAVSPGVGLALAGLIIGPHLGAEMASHWSGNASKPDGFTPTVVSFWSFAAITVALTIAGVIGVFVVARGGGSRVWPMTTTLIAGFTACAWIAAAWATADGADLQHAALGGRLAIMLVPAAVAAVVYVLLPPVPITQSGAVSAPTVSAGVGDRLAWSGITGSRVLAVAVGVVGASFVAVLTGWIITRQPGLLVSASALLLATLSALLLEPVRLTVDRRGIRLSSALLRVPLIRVRLEDIDEVLADTVDPARWGGWGYRISGAGVAYVARKGPGLIIKKRSGGAVAITIKDPDQPAAVANTLNIRARRALQE
jgi:hypothetical protein